jgi:hypothetical protein
MKKIFYILTFSFLILTNYSCFNSVSSKKELEEFVNNNSFENKNPLDYRDIYTFDNNKFTEINKNKRTDKIQTIYRGTYEVKSSKYYDNGEKFYYIKLSYDDRYSKRFLVFYDDNLIIPYNDGIEDMYEDEVGLNLPEWHVSLAQDFLKYKKTN